MFRRLGEKKVFGTELNNRIIWILIEWFLHFFIIGALLIIMLSEAIFARLLPHDTLPDQVVFVLDSYLESFLPLFVYAFIYTRFTRKNRFIFESFLPGRRSNKVSKLLGGFLAGFLTNAFCVVVALLFGFIKLRLDFYISDIPFYIFAFVCVLIQSATEELWNRGILMERIHVHYPLWVGMVINAAVFAALHLGNPGISALPIINLFICGLEFSVLSWSTDSIWFPIGAHTAWNFTQNLLFGLPNSGLVSRVSVFRLEAANASNSLIYDSQFGVEGSIPAVIADTSLMLLYLYFAYKDGRLGELLKSKESAAKPAEKVPEEITEGEI